VEESRSRGTPKKPPLHSVVESPGCGLNHAQCLTGLHLPVQSLDWMCQGRRYDLFRQKLNISPGDGGIE